MDERRANRPASEWVVPPKDDIIDRLNRRHPRLLITDDSNARIKDPIRKGGQASRWHESLLSQAEALLSQEPLRYEIPDGLRLLSVSRGVQARIYVLALLHCLDGGRRYAERAWRELEAAAQFPDWNPRHFLDTAEMTHAFAIGYDWLHGEWGERQLQILRDAIVEKGLKPALQCYRGEANYGWWVRSEHNWNQVCNGGISVGALAVADELPELAGEVLHSALLSLKLSMSRFAPDGAWAEGPGYWNYATSYNVLLLAALETALGSDFGYSGALGFSETGLFPIYLTGPSGLSFNFADCHEEIGYAPQMLWLARKFDRPTYAWFELQTVVPEPLDLVWFYEHPKSPNEVGIPLDKHFRNVEVVTMRGAWDDRDATFVGFKAGDNSVNHSNLDVGTFVLDVMGHRWAVDLGADDYNLPEYFGGKRWTYYRMRAEGHNTLVINPGEGPDQDPKAVTRISRFGSKRDSAYAIADLTPAYGRDARAVMRGIWLQDRQLILIQDELRMRQASDVWWFMHTRSRIEEMAGGRDVVLTQGGARLWARIIQPEDARFGVMDAVPLPTSVNPQGQSNNEGVHKLSIHLKGVAEARVAVSLAPFTEGKSPQNSHPIAPLAKW